MARVSGQIAERLRLGHGGRGGLGTGQDHCLRQFGDSELAPDDRRGCRVRRHTRRHVPVHAGLVESPGLLGERRVDRGITGAESRHIVPALMSRDQMLGNLIKIKMLAVDQGRSRRAVSQDLIIDVAAGIDAHERGLNQPYGSHSQQVRCPWTGPDEMDSHSTALIELHWTTALAGRQP